MHVRSAEAATRNAGDVEIKNLITRAECSNVSVAEAELDGSHGPSRNHLSDRIYYLISGRAVVTIDGDTHEIAPGDVVLIPKGAVHAVSGTAHYLVINSPAFDPGREEDIPT